MRLIDADAIKHEITKYHAGLKPRYISKLVDAEIADIQDIIDESPTVYAEHVITGETSDGYHTFNELYHHRAVLFSVIVKAFRNKAWKSKKHHDGTMYDGMFIVGIETPDGQATYHYDIEPYWDMFCCKEVEFAPEWDGHSPSQAIERIGKLEPVMYSLMKIPKCGGMEYLVYNESCKNCFAKMDGGADDD